MKIRLIPAAIMVASLSLPATAQVLKGDEITESALVEALTPEENIRTRSIRVQPDSAPVKPASASLLITFQTNSAELTSEARQSLDVVARALNDDKLADFKFTIEGHADPRGSSDLNLRLSQARADAVREYLRGHSVRGERLAAIGKGDRELLNEKNPTAPENRRVTIVTVPE